MAVKPRFNTALKFADGPAARQPPKLVDSKVESLVNDLIGTVADKWTMLIIEALHEKKTLRFTQVAREVDGISQKMLTQTLRQMERNGLVHREVYPTVPPKVEYSLTKMGLSLGAAFCGVWKWAEANTNPQID
jgi:DNA-binding HxlR family transcriptional regulator